MSSRLGDTIQDSPCPCRMALELYLFYRSLGWGLDGHALARGSFSVNNE